MRIEDKVLQGIKVKLPGGSGGGDVKHTASTLLFIFSYVCT